MPGNRKLLVADMDDVLVNCTPKWVRKATQDPEIGQLPGVAALAARGGSLRDATMGRPAYYLQKWLSVPAYADGRFNALYREDPSFYDGLPPTPFAESVRLALAGFGGAVEHVHVVTLTMGGGDPVNESKVRWLESFFEGHRGKVTFHLTPPGVKKSEVMLRHCQEPDAFADDSLGNVADVLLVEKVRPKQILIPKMGHNYPAHAEIAQLAALSRVELSYYSNLHHPEEEH
jgi:hypothetical protein